jgi:hypothetical protein
MTIIRSAKAPYLLACAIMRQPTADESIITHAIDARMAYCFLFKNSGAFRNEKSHTNIPSKKLKSANPKLSARALYAREASMIGAH